MQWRNKRWAGKGMIGGSRRRTATGSLLVTMGLFGGLFGWTQPAPAATPVQSGTAGSKANCIYAGPGIAGLNNFAQASGITFNCAVVYNNAVTTWPEWDTPWFEQEPDSNLNWAKWVAADPGRQLIITEDMVPSGSPSDWREIGATGAYDQYAFTLAQNLVNHGLGNSVIRLGHELNYTADIASVGTTAADYAAWVAYWQDIVTTMRSVPGADFVFDWNLNAGYRNIPLASVYPGDSYVDIISVDQYDDTVSTPTGSTPQQDWQQIWNQPDGLATVLDFAQSHGKPVAFPEWGLAATTSHGFGDDPYYISEMASVVQQHDTAYQAYFYSGQSATLLSPASQSFQQYVAAFGSPAAGGSASTTSTTSTTTIPPTSKTTTSTPTPATTTTTPTGTTTAPVVPSGTSVASLGDLSRYRLSAPIVAGSATSDHKGYWLLGGDGGVFRFGDAGFFGSTGNVKLNQPIVAMASTADGHGYWLVASDGGVFAFGDAHFYGSTGNVKLNRPIVAMAPTADGRGYWLIASDGGVFAFGDAHFYGSTGHIPLAQPIVAMFRSVTGAGYTLIAGDGGIFQFGDSVFVGSAARSARSSPIVSGAAAPAGNGYWIVGRTGTVYAFGSAVQEGNATGTVAAIIPTASDRGYWVATTSGRVLPFGRN
jgi:hypothetical protein